MMLKSHFPVRFSFNLLLALSLIGLAAASWAQSVTDDFNDAADDGWTRYNPINTGSWTLSGGAYRIQSSASPSPAAIGPGRAGSIRTTETYTQFSVSVDIVAWDNSLDQIFGLITRVGTPGPGTTKGYGFTYATRTGRSPTGLLQILRIAQEAGTDITVASNFTFVVGQSYRMVLEGEVSTLRAKLFSTSNLSTPLVTLTAVDTTYTSGGAGVFTYDNSRTAQGRADTTFDNFSSAELGPRLQIDRDAFSSDIRLSWPSWATAYRLERSYELPTPFWDDLGAGFELSGDRWIMFDDGTTPGAFYRLTSP